MSTSILFTAWIFQLLVPVSAEGYEGVVILSVFIPATLLVLALCLGRACWEWHLIYGLGHWTYDPYLDTELRNTHPARVEPPASTGRVARSFCHGKVLLGPDEICVTEDDSNAIAPMSRLALATHKIGEAMVTSAFPRDTTAHAAHEQANVSSQTRGELRSYKQDNTTDANLSAISQEMSLCETRSEANAGDSMLSCKHVHIRDQKQAASRFLPGGVSQRATSSTHKTHRDGNPPGRAVNPYGYPILNFSKIDRLSPERRRRDSSKRRSNLKSKFCGKKFLDRTTSPTTPQGQQQPRFSTFVRMKCAQFRERVSRYVASRRSRHPTARELQRDVKEDEDRAMSSVSTICGQLWSGFITAESNAAPGTFGLGPVVVPLVEMVPLQQKTPRQTLSRQTPSPQTSPPQILPRQTMSRQAPPQQTPPRQTTPRHTSPRHTLPRQTPPRQTLPRQAPPRQTSPSQTLSPQTQPRQTLARQTLPRQSTPLETPRQSFHPHKSTTTKQIVSQAQSRRPYFKTLTRVKQDYSRHRDRMLREHERGTVVQPTATRIETSAVEDPPTGDGLVSEECRGEMNATLDHNNTHTSHNASCISDDEEYLDAYNAMFEELFAKAGMREHQNQNQNPHRTERLFRY